LLGRISASDDYTCGEHLRRQPRRRGPSKMGKKMGSIAGFSMNRKHMSNNRKKNLLNKQNRKNIKEKQAKDPAKMLTTKPM
ncbi:MAG: hypothetical protein ACPIOQ_78275, partial [Promethearchaeia archaeon]